MKTTPRIVATHAQHIGDREEQEDAIGVLHLGARSAHPCTVAVVADGIGGHAHGEVASRRAVDAVLREAKRCWRLLARPDNPKIRLLLDTMVRAACSAVVDIDPTAQGRRRAGTTLLIAICWRDRFIIRNVGDSRATWVCRELRERVDLTPLHHVGNSLTSLIPSPDIQDTFERVWPPDTTTGRHGGVLVLSSDGLTLSPDDIWTTSSITPDAVDVASALVADQLHRDLTGQDNVSVIALEWR